MSQIFMGWFDNSNLPLSQKIQKALNYHEKKYGVPPTLVELPLNEGEVEGLNIKIKRNRYIPVRHMLIGVENNE